MYRLLVASILPILNEKGKKDSVRCLLLISNMCINLQYNNNKRQDLPMDVHAFQDFLRSCKEILRKHNNTIYFLSKTVQQKYFYLHV